MGTKIFIALALIVYTAQAGPGYGFDSFSADQRLALQHPGSCQWSCNDDSGKLTASGVTSGSPPEQDAFAECWGVFKFWCKSSCNKAREAASAKAEVSMARSGAQEGGMRARNSSSTWFWGLSCRGHFMTAQWNQSVEGAPSHHRLLACEGGWRSIAGSVATCPATGATVKTMQGSWAQGTSSLITAHAPRPQPEPQPAPPQPAGGDDEALAASLTGVRAPPSLDRPEWNGKASRTLAQRMSAAAPAAAAPPGSRAVSVEARSDGAGGTWRVTRRLDPGAPLGLTQDEVEAEAEDTLAPSWSDWLPTIPRHHHRRGGKGEGGEGRGEGEGGCPHGGEFRALCNGRDAWLHGEVPCLGNFTLAVKHKPTPLPAPTAGDLLAASRRLLADPAAALNKGSIKTGSKPVVVVEVVGVDETTAAVPAPMRGGRNPHHANTSFALTAECDGLWTGFFGHACRGLGLTHVLVEGQEGEGACAWSADSWDVCSGCKRVQRLHRGSARGMAVMCHGQAAAHKLLVHTPGSGPRM